MDLHLIASFDALAWLIWAGTILKVAVGLGLVIFVHELGHFLVAKACGVKCEKFYLGFDINGWKICKFQWGETEYGIGVLPLGGYVKMLGQDDNPTKAAEERERAKLKEPHTAAVNHPGDLPAEPTSDEHVPYDPRSYMAKSVPQRMAIISAGVIMNLIFAVIFAAIAYRCGMRYIPCVIGSTSPGDPAWVAGIQPGDKIVQLGDDPQSEHLRFDHDLKMHVIFSDAEGGLKLQVRRSGTDQIADLVVRPTGDDPKKRVIGVLPIESLKLATEAMGGPTIAGTSAAKAKPAFEGGDKIVFIREIDNQHQNRPIPDHLRMEDLLAKFANDLLRITVERENKDDPSAKPTQISIDVAPNPMHVLGVVMASGPIVAIQKGSPAEAAGFQIDDRIVSVNGERDFDPLRLSELLGKHPGEEATIEVERKVKDGPAKTVTIKVTPRTPRNFWPASAAGNVGVDELGIAYAISNTVQSVEAGSPADGKLQPGDEITSALPPLTAEEAAKLNIKKKFWPSEPIEFNAEHHSWTRLHAMLQQVPAGQKVDLTFTRKGKENKATIETVASKDWFNPERGLVVEVQTEIRPVDSWGEALALGFNETKESIWQVTTTLRMLGTGKVSPTDLAGPIGIAEAAAASASEGIPTLLLFLTFLSANLAVINFLPIPILDGGHMMFLLYEGIRGKPASERTMMTLTYVGLIFILALFLFVSGLDITRWFK